MSESSTLAAKAEILWDEWGVPHIYAGNDDDACFGVGWAQARAHATLILELYGIARGRAAEYWGPQFRAADVTAWTMGLPDLGAQWWTSQPGQTRRRVEAFCAGFNAWCASRPEIAATRREALPVVPADIYAHYARNLFHYTQIISDGRTQVFPAEPVQPPGSNAWAIAGRRSTSGSALLLCSPHLLWTGRFIFFEVHSVSPGRDFYGACGVGLPWAAIGFNDTVGWTHTVNPMDLFDVYKLSVEGNGYRFDGEVLPFETESRAIAVRQADGTTSTEQITVRHSVHGPVVRALDGTTAAVRVAGLTVRPAVDGLDGWWEMSRARGVDHLAGVLRRWQLPLFSVIAADREGRIAGIYAGRPPVRPRGTFADWEGWIPGDSSQWLWTDTHPQSDLPELIDPESGFLQSTNDPPWTMTWPPALKPDDYAPTIAPAPGFPGFRALAAIEPLLSAADVSIDDLVRLSFSTRVRLADHLLDDILVAASDRDDPLLREAGEVLARWDRHASANSPGAVLFLSLLAGLAQDLPVRSLFAREWTSEEPFTTPTGLRDPRRCLDVLRRAASGLRDAGRPLDVTIGAHWRMRVRGQEVPADGGPGVAGVLKALTVAPDPDGRHHTAVFGYMFMAAVEFSTPVRAKGLLVYENWTEPSPLAPGRQLRLALESRLRPIHLSRSDVEGHLREREIVSR